MDQGEKSDHPAAGRYFGLSRKLYIFLICFIFSSLIWALIKLSKDYSETVSYPVIYSGIPADKVLISDTSSTLTMQIKTKGFTILSNSVFSRIHAIKLNVGSLLKKMKNSINEYYILTSSLYQAVGSQILYPNNISSIDPDTLHFTLVNKYVKKLPVIVNLNLSFDQQFELSDSVKYQPDSVTVSGPKAVLDTLKYIGTVSKSISTINSDQYVSLAFNSKYRTSRLTITPATVKAFIAVEKYTEAWVDLPISIINNPNNYIVRTFPENTRVTFQVSLSKYKEAIPAMFSAVADISKALLANSKKMKVEITKYPSFVKIMKTDPDKIEYILLK